MSEQHSIGERIRNLRAQAQLDQAVLAEAVGTARTHLTNIERGRSKPGRDLLMAFAKFFGVSVDWLATGEGPKRINETLTTQELLLINAFRKLNENEAELHLKLIVAHTEKGEGS
ncbi:helix-turn-helix domain-containing protein [Komagataeibacter saccharivorans]|uniref:helix-turn-helix domain-containing protein n=1 Tax=Komagataeibacter saccharivorans TaxID=265959 RepID=UPI0024A8B37C|nr:helix-turn-helix transcriptional regulator [Komagataeibacter saccharivorans]